MRTDPPAMSRIVWTDRAVFSASVAAVALLLGPGYGPINALCGPAPEGAGAMSWPELLYELPEDGFVRMMAALGLVLAVRLLTGVLLAFAARVPGRTGVRAAWMSMYVTPPPARRLVHLLISVSLSSWTGAALAAAPALAATSPAATVVPAPVLAPPEATLQTWPDLARPGVDVRSSLPRAAHRTGQQSWPDLGRPGTAAPSAPTPKAAPKLTKSPSADAPGPKPPARPAGHAAASQPASSPTAAAAAAAPAATDVVVTAGDCLWTLAARDLEQRGMTEPTPRDIATATEKWWQANRSVIGTDPDRLMPGEHLRPPA
jgi:resuscitation-promoting factor RpfA